MVKIKLNISTRGTEVLGGGREDRKLGDWRRNICMNHLWQELFLL